MKKLTSDLGAVAAALRKSPNLLEVNEDGTKVKRKLPLPADTPTHHHCIYVVRARACSQLALVCCRQCMPGMRVEPGVVCCP